MPSLRVVQTGDTRDREIIVIFIKLVLNKKKKIKFEKIIIPLETTRR
jgi:hypothetical protein